MACLGRSRLFVARLLESIASPSPQCFDVCARRSVPLLRGTPGASLFRSTFPLVSLRGLQTTSVCLGQKSPMDALEGPKKWPAYNKIVLPPQSPEEPRRAAQVFHMRTQIRYKEHILWFMANMIRGLSIDEAVKQLGCRRELGATIITEVLREAQEIALRDHNFEFKSKMWVSESFAVKAVCVKSVRRHGKKRYGRVRFNFCHYFVKLQEGDPPAKVWDNPYHDKTPKEWMELHLNDYRSRRVIHSL